MSAERPLPRGHHRADQLHPAGAQLLGAPRAVARSARALRRRPPGAHPRAGRPLLRRRRHRRRRAQRRRRSRADGARVAFASFAGEPLLRRRQPDAPTRSSPSASPKPGPSSRRRRRRRRAARIGTIEERGRPADSARGEGRAGRRVVALPSRVPAAGGVKAVAKAPRGSRASCARCATATGARAGRRTSVELVLRAVAPLPRRAARARADRCPGVRSATSPRAADGGLGDRRQSSFRAEWLERELGHEG